MLYYAKIKNENTKECFVPNQIKAKNDDWEQLDLDVGYDGKFYLKGYAPQEPIEIMKYNVRIIRNSYLEKTDKYMLIDFPIIEDVKQKYIKYRNYLRNYTNQENWWKYNPKTFEEWDNNNES